MFSEDGTVLRTQALAHIRRESLDIFNRLHSIAEDCEFVNRVCTAYPEFPVVPNLRCGAWYVDPSCASAEAAYFKSTDGHFGNWSFNLRRPNIHLLSAVIGNGGFLLVDSTRSGKRMPDALSKTVPIWCAVVNRAVKSAHGKDITWDTALYTPPGSVSRQEHAQIETRVNAWAVSLIASSYDLPNLAFPLRPLWITPATTSYPQVSAMESSERVFSPIICVSASRQIEEGLERRSNGYCYVQGSGDDHELWGQGLSPTLYWANKSALLRTPRHALEGAVRDLVSQHLVRNVEQRAVAATGVARVRGKILIGSLSELPQPLGLSSDAVNDMAFVVISESGSPEPEHGEAGNFRSETVGDQVLRLRLPEGKRGQKQLLADVIPRSVFFIDQQLSRGSRVCICCDTGKDSSVGVALVALQLYFDNNGEFIESEHRKTRPKADKSSVNTRLQWIITSRPQANPSRATLKRVNEFLMTPESLRAPIPSPLASNTARGAGR